MTERDAAAVRMIELHLISLAELLPSLQLTLIARRMSAEGEPADPDAYVIVGGEDLEALEAVLARAKARRMQ